MSYPVRLTSPSRRMAVLLRTIDAMKDPSTPGAMTLAELEAHADAEAAHVHHYRRPCMADGIYFHSVISAAHYLSRAKPHFWNASKAARDMNAHAVIENLRARVRRMCDSGKFAGYSWV